MSLTGSDGTLCRHDPTHLQEDPNMQSQATGGGCGDTIALRRVSTFDSSPAVTA